MKIEDRLRSALREFTETIHPDGNAWTRIEARMDARAPGAAVPRRSFVMAAAAIAAIIALVAVRLVADARPGEIGLIGPGPTIETPPSSVEPSPRAVPTVDGRWVRLPSTPTSHLWSSVWTGSEFIVWTERYRQRGIGFAYSPKTRRWRAIAETEIGGVGRGAAVWTGSEMIVWGAESGVDVPPSRQGAAYDPDRDRWRPIAQAPLRPKYDHTAVWTGKEMIVWGLGGPVGQFGTDPPIDSFVNEGAAYDPRTDRWRQLPPAPISKRGFALVVWTGTEMIVWGGGGFSDPPRDLIDGAAYDPAQDRWRAIPPAPLSPRAWPGGTWTGTEMIVWGGQGCGDLCSDGARYDPATDRWTLMSRSPLAPRAPTMVPTPAGVFIWAGIGPYVEGSDDRHFGKRNDGAIYDPRTDSWSVLPAAPLAPRTSFSAAFTGGGVLVWGGCCPSDEVGYEDGALFVFGRG